MINTSTATSSDRLIEGLDPARPVLIAGPTASGKSALALRIAQALGGAVVNADALQVWSCWRVLTARPSPEDEAAAQQETDYVNHVFMQQNRKRRSQATALKA